MRGTNLEILPACDEHESIYKCRVSGFPLHLRHSQRKWTFCYSIVWGKISNEVTTESSKVHLSASEHGCFRTAIETTRVLQTAPTPIFEEGALHIVDRNQSTSVLSLAVSIQRSRVTVHRAAYFRFMYRECSYYSQKIIQNESSFRRGLLTEVRKTYNLSIPCYSVMKFFRTKWC
ncbi:hypothetical protein TNCV_2760671 [Trichonephila clavipes]|nr:hypothetical protein TNCV_2760671 [Trichonephila clavipes]